MKNAFTFHLFHLKHFLFSRYLNFCSLLFDREEKQLDWKGKVNFKTYDITTRETNIGNIHIAYEI